jgi:hypothetical protein
MANDKIKVLYIAGWGRSGSTILGNILGQVAGFFDECKTIRWTSSNSTVGSHWPASGSVVEFSWN